MLDRGLAWALARSVPVEVAGGLARLLRGLVSPVVNGPPRTEWWRRPGLGVMYQVEYRPGMDWDRDFNQFNRSMMNEAGHLRFNGPFCKVDEWVRLSREAGVDYHVMEIKWHDGICYFDTDLTDWKTEEDYAAGFARSSRGAGIPFMFYYSSIFDHNPLFDRVQPRSDKTVSFIGLPGNPVYDEYIRGQYREIMERYRPDGMWIDWYWPDESTRTTLELFRAEYPGTVLTFNVSSLFASSYSRLHYTSGEAHELDGPYLRVERTNRGVVVVFKSAWKLSTLARRVLEQPWELVTPAGRWWQDPRLRDDPYDLVRMAAVVMSSGGKLCPGVAARLDGSLYPDQVRQLTMLGEWYRPRRALFAGSVPLRYKGREPSGVRVSPRNARTIACRNGKDIILHVVNMDGSAGPVRVEFSGKRWSGIERAYLEPSGRELPVFRSGSRSSVTIARDEVDPVDNILRLQTPSGAGQP